MCERVVKAGFRWIVVAAPRLMYRYAQRHGASAPEQPLLDAADARGHDLRASVFTCP